MSVISWLRKNNIVTETVLLVWSVVLFVSLFFHIWKGFVLLAVVADLPLNANFNNTTNKTIYYQENCFGKVEIALDDAPPTLRISLGKDNPDERSPDVMELSDGGQMNWLVPYEKLDKTTQLLVYTGFYILVVCIYQLLSFVTGMILELLMSQEREGGKVASSIKMFYAQFWLLWTVVFPVALSMVNLISLSPWWNLFRIVTAFFVYRYLWNLKTTNTNGDIPPISDAEKAEELDPLKK